MPLNGLIDGNAPPFILLVFVMGAIYDCSVVLKETEQIVSGARFKRFARSLIYFSMLVFLILGFAIIFRIAKNGSPLPYNFKSIDTFILSSIVISYLLLVTNALILSQIRRKYQEINPCEIKINNE